MAVPSEPTVLSKSPHVSDPTLAPFLQPQFDPAEYLNSTLPNLSLSTVSSRPLKQGTSVTLSELSSQTSDLLSQLNAHTTRLSAILTQLTDDILRSGARLAYEVEVLRGETLGLTETLSDTLAPSIKNFVPGGISLELPKPTDETTTINEDTNPTSEETDVPPQKDEDPNTTTTAPPYITHLETLTLVRTRLDTVIKTFGEAMHWTLPPSEISLTSSLISVSAPSTSADPSSSDAPTREQKGKEFAAALRTEIADLLMGEDGVEAARVRVQALRDLAGVWKGTVEEKARTRFVEGLAKMVEERVRSLEVERERASARVAGRSVGGKRDVGSANAGKSEATAGSNATQQRSGGGGFLDNLQRIRESYI
ncbi:hypothetical protein DM02DRAFT_614419 [Periconia macrospinosa]|uniref:Uncharacterized protein n=1 Tax=Periconia macrospinosa TaxID=97972 RepID=A0A2V1DR23_9PLEO|nr:hypothetical protein DM02DRAFT_614419 [Periconia macrospinosa]